MTAAKAPARREALGALPSWDLADLYPGRDSPELETRPAARAQSLGEGVPRSRYQGTHRGALGQ